VVVPRAGLIDPGWRGERLAGIRPVLTAIDGEVVHRDPAFDPDA
jgi:hypothetical protein